ncbi:DUF222 domain-containing protein [Nocardioides sp. R1-1]|uniref:DUF222 domain-containing protein n=1 Tax=Nocardioides sp. R1-1 TaxID=3383502 RepID=UPI0038D12D6C
MHAAATFGARIQTSPYGAKRLIADAVDLHHRLPRPWAGVRAGRVRSTHARHVAEATRELSAPEAGWVDGEVVEVADGRLGWARFQAVVEGKVAAFALLTNPDAHVDPSVGPVKPRGCRSS